MSDERRRILEMLAQGKITTDEAEALLRALAPGGAPADTGRPKPRFLRINVHKPATAGRADRDVNIRVPIAIVRSGMQLGAIIPGLAGDHVRARLRERGLDLDLSRLDPATFEAMLNELGEMHIDVDSGRAQVRITCE